MTVTIGTITHREGAKLHLDIDGGIGDNHTRRVTSPIRDAAKLQAGDVRLCRRCFTPARIADAQRSIETVDGAAAEAMRQFLASVTRSMKTPQELAAEEPMVADLIASIQAANRINGETRDPQTRLDLWDAARDSYDAPLLVA